tara:strand:- start:7 stop:183 length:177 start_codon:yes stop_codon:yes gene_type:complete
VQLKHVKQLREERQELKGDMAWAWVIDSEQQLAEVSLCEKGAWERSLSVLVTNGVNNC